jgi:hypothetical protein
MLHILLAMTANPFVLSGFILFQIRDGLSLFIVHYHLEVMSRAIFRHIDQVR